MASAMPRRAVRAVSRLVELSAERAGTHPVELAISCFQQSGREVTLAEQLRERIPNVRDVGIVEASTVIGAHVGPGALSVTVSPV